MKAEIKITIEINGKEEAITFEEGRKIYEELGKIYGTPIVRFEPAPWKWPNDWRTSPILTYGVSF